MDREEQGKKYGLKKSEEEVEEWFRRFKSERCASDVFA